MNTDSKSKPPTTNPNARAGYYRPVKHRKPPFPWGTFTLVVIACAWVGIGLGVIAAEREGVTRAVLDVFTRARSRAIDTGKRHHVFRQGER